MTLIALLAAFGLGLSCGLVTYSLGKWRRTGRPVEFRGRPVGRSSWLFALLLVLGTVWLPIAMLHDALFDRPWIEWGR